MVRKIDFMELKLNIDDILYNPSYSYSLTEADFLKKQAEETSKRRNLPEALKLEVRALKIYENLLGNNGRNEDLLYKTAKCYDFGGKFLSIVAQIAHKEDKFNWNYMFSSLSRDFKKKGAKDYIKSAMLTDDTYRKDMKLIFAADCFKRASYTSTILGDFKTAKRLNKKAFYFYMRSKQYKKAIWCLGKVIEDLCNFEEVPEKTIYELLEKVKVLLSIHGNPKGFNIGFLESKIEKSLR